jgi:hypothetical protein
MKKRREASAPHAVQEPAALTFREGWGRFFMRYSMADGRLIPAVLITVVICGILIYVALSHMAI